MPEAEQAHTILVVEDEESVRMAIEAGLEVLGNYRVFTAPDAATGMQMLEETKPEILLLDLVMPVTDGMEFLRIMRTNPGGYRPAKVILMTAHSNPVPSGNLEDLGLDLVLPKPFRLKELAAAVGAKNPFSD